MTPELDTAIALAPLVVVAGILALVGLTACWWLTARADEPVRPVMDAAQREQTEDRIWQARLSERAAKGHRTAQTVVPFERKVM